MEEADYNITSYKDFKLGWPHLSEEEIKKMYSNYVKSTKFHQDLDSGIFDI